MTKQILNTLKGAKSFLSTRHSDGKTLCICYAITDYVNSVYGDYSAHTYNTEPSHIREAAQAYVRHELAKLTDSSFFDYDAAKALGREYNLNIQEARHIWLDQLIANLEQI